MSVEVADAHAEPATRDLTAIFQLAVDELRLVGWNRKPHALKSAIARQDGRVDAHYFPAGVHQRPAGVAGVDGAIDLNEVFITRLAENPGLPIERAHDAVRHRTDVSEWRAEGHDDIAFFKLVAITPRGGDELVRLNFDYGQIGLRIGAQNFRAFDFAAVVQGDFDFIRITGHMVVGENPAARTVGFHDHAGTLALLVEAAVVLGKVGFAVAVFIGEESLERFIIERKLLAHVAGGARCFFGDFNKNHRRLDRFTDALKRAGEVIQLRKLFAAQFHLLDRPGVSHVLHQTASHVPTGRADRAKPHHGNRSLH